MRYNRKCFKCKICKGPHFAKGFCRNHYTKYSRCGNPLGVKHKCKNDFCNRTAHAIFCSKCKRHKDPTNPSPHQGAPLGKDNGRWNNGNSEYKHHNIMKAQRKIKLEQAHWICELCGKHAYMIHHKDKDKTNHELSNLMAICPTCHIRLHRSIQS